ncbi:MAG TPA: 50S ribosomal protein L5 [Candidatus Campbellbacteria bacterium]|nr:50S ribosomal protein L5 [Candidatus Campbellbacteria bacterium]
MQTLKEKYNKTVVPEMKKKFGYKSNFAVPKILKVVISTGTGSLKDENKKKIIEKSLALITGQKPVENPAKKSIASFKLRQGMTIGYSVTVRRKRMYSFLEKLINAAIPRIRDFRGLDSSSIDETGNLTIGFKEHIVFPEVSDQDVRESFGLGVTVATNAKTKPEAVELLKFIGFPIK